MHTSIKFIVTVIFVFTLTACLEKVDHKETITIETPSGQWAVFSVDIADTREEMQKGLMFVEEMTDEEGMIFIYPEPQLTKFWMKNTLIPLDMLFFDKNNTLVHIEHSAQPHDESPRGPDSEDICSVVEINAGLAKETNIEIGSKLMTNLTQECLHSSHN